MNTNIIFFISILSTALFVAKILKSIKLKLFTMPKIDRMTGIQFENYLIKLYKRKGYKVFTTPASNDYGADLILKKFGRVTIVQAKRYKGKVSNSAVQEIVAAKNYYNAHNCMVVTNSYFTQNAINLAKANNVLLWDRDKLIKEIKKM